MELSNRALPAQVELARVFPPLTLSGLKAKIRR